MPKKKDFFIFLLKFIFSFSIIAYLLIKIVPINDFLKVLKGANILWLLLSFSLHSLGLLISAYRWQILIQAQGDRVPLGFLAKSYLVGTFFNNFLPTRFGGDIVRIWDGSRYSRSVLKSSAIVLVERFTGIIVLLLFAFVASLSRLEMAKKIPIIWISLLVGLLGLLFVLSFFMPFAKRILGKIPDKGYLKKIKAKVFEFRDVVLVYKDKKREFLKALFWAFLLQVNVILHYFLVGKALHLNISFIDYFIFIPIILIILIIPVTISGLGLREGIYIEIFKFYLIPAALAFSFPLIADVAFGLIIGIIGGIIYVLRK
ncbi:MAG: flippase-like domain-containing protein [Candidatus Aminicenantes bacterium]|nr:MAG: flippase-like domain-containing protein [Candidatus Aminicenantes bacterium]